MSNETESEPMRVRDAEGIPTEDAVLRREYLKLVAEHDRLAAKCLRYKEGLELVANLRDSEESRIARIYLKP